VRGGLATRTQLLCLRTAARLVAGRRSMQWLVWLLERLFDAENSVIVDLPQGGKLELFLNDGYWIPLISTGYAYEPEVAFFLRHLLSRDDAYFVDCGANIGYWSVFASELVGPGRVLAIEASPAVFDRLARNAVLNSGRFACVLAAVWHRDGEKLGLVRHERRHARSSVVDLREKIGEAGYAEDTVSSITLDTLCERELVPRGCLVVKLDVEGAEIQALRGAARLIQKGEVALIYEDHGADEDSRTSRHVRDVLGFNVYYCSSGLRPARIESDEALRRIKRDRRKGYNFAACRPDSAFARLLDKLVASPV
jgi:FkbM family methyltransferase